MDGLFARVTYNGKTGCVYYKGVRDLPQDTPVTPYAAYLPNAKYLFAKPMDRAEALRAMRRAALAHGERAEFGEDVGLVDAVALTDVLDLGHDLGVGVIAAE